jgi:hypothetical protein
LCKDESFFKALLSLLAVESLSRAIRCSGDK